MIPSSASIQLAIFEAITTTAAISFNAIASSPVVQQGALTQSASSRIYCPDSRAITPCGLQLRPSSLSRRRQQTASHSPQQRFVCISCYVIIIITNFPSMVAPIRTLCVANKHTRAEEESKKEREKEKIAKISTANEIMRMNKWAAIFGNKQTAASLTLPLRIGGYLLSDHNHKNKSKTSECRALRTPQQNDTATSAVNNNLIRMRLGMWQLNGHNILLIETESDFFLLSGL